MSSAVYQPKNYSMQIQDLGATVTEVFEYYRSFWEEQGFQVDRTIERDLLVRHDPDAVSQAVLNLLDNAIKYSGDSRNVEVLAYGAQGTAFLEIRDHGIGMPRE